MKYLGKLWEFILQNNKLNQKLNACLTNFIYIHIHIDVPVLPLDYLYKIDDSYQYVFNDCEKKCEHMQANFLFMQLEFHLH